MANFTNFLGLILPGFEEYQDSWDVPVNQNTAALDTAIQGISTEIVAARQSKTSLLAFLQVAHNADGTLLAAPEVVRARVSPVFGFLTAGGAPAPLKARLDSLDYELYYARRGQATLVDGVAFTRSGLKDMVLSGSSSGGAPTWLGATSATVRIDGASQALYFLIGGYPARVRTLRSLTISGATGTHYLVATYAAPGTVNMDGTVSASGQTSADGSGNMTLFTDSTTNFALADCQPGDLLTLTGSGDAGQYVIGTVAPSGVQTQLQIIGTFPVGGLSSIPYTVTDPLGVTLSQQTTAVVADGKFVFGEADFDGTAVVGLPRPRAFKDSYNSPWKYFDLSSATSHEEIFSHFLGSDVLDVEVHVSQASDGTQTVELLSVAQLTQDTSVVITDGKTVTVANTLTFNPGTTNATLTGGAQPLSGAVTATLGGTITAAAGAVVMSRSAAVKWDRNYIYVRNSTPSLLYQDYSGVQHQTGYVRVVVRKRG